MFESIETAPPDAILGLTEAFKKDSRPEKINLGVGVYKDAENNTPVLDSVKQAEQRILADEDTKTYMPMTGSPEYASVVQRLIFGEGHEIIINKRAVTAHTPGGTGALRLGGDFIQKHFPSARLWVCEPTWANHNGIFKSVGLDIQTYPYYDADKKCLAFDAMMETLETIPEGDVVLLHGCCHNPCGMDPNPEEWAAIAQIATKRKFLPFLDFAYQGLAGGLEEDAAGLRTLCSEGCELFVASSFSKNFGLYNERVGALTIVAPSEEVVQRVASQLKLCARTSYSNPPAHGAKIVTTVYNDDTLRALWQNEVKAIRDRINDMRRLLVDTLKAQGVSHDFSFIAQQNGMFSFSGLNKDQVNTLREKYAVYIVGSGRINVAGITPKNIDTLCQAIANVLSE